MQAEPRTEHRWLDQLLGDWTVTSDGMDAGAPSRPWTEHVRPLGGLWVVAEGQGEMPGGGGPASTLMTLGYDPRSGRYVGIWAGSMMSQLWVYDGSLDPSGRALILDCEGPDFEVAGKMARAIRTSSPFSTMAGGR